jgi:hypothetical protein
MEISAEIATRQEDILTYKFKHAVVAGVGGIGSWVALDLALSGQVEVIHLIDPDNVENSNLNRTPFRICDVSFPKVHAMKYIIMERRASVEVHTYQDKTNPDMIDLLRNTLNNDIALDKYEVGRLIDSLLIIDCRDDVYEDLYCFNCKYYKVGYDGLSITIDGNPRQTAVWGEANNYRFTPSFIAPAQMIASMVVVDALAEKELDDGEELPPWDSITNEQPFDLRGRINKSFTIDAREVVSALYRNYLEGVVDE